MAIHSTVQASEFNQGCWQFQKWSTLPETSNLAMSTLLFTVCTVMLMNECLCSCTPVCCLLGSVYFCCICLTYCFIVFCFRVSLGSLSLWAPNMQDSQGDQPCTDVIFLLLSICLSADQSMQLSIYLSIKCLLSYCKWQQLVGRFANMAIHRLHGVAQT